MLSRIIDFSVSNKLIIALLTILMAGWGVYSLTHLPVDAVPDITENQVQVITVSPSLGAPDVERQITIPVELANRNIPGLKKVRSFSRFGLSLVTLVFTDATDIYWARQQVSERLITVRAQIPPEIGIPEIAPLSTGLGEIYQYVVKPKPGYESRYDAMELRTIQDHLVRKQLLGTPGVADVSSFGGKLKQYEIAVNPDRLAAAGISMQDVFTALENNNQNTGGAYIEKGPNILFIRSEGLVRTEDDIARIPIKTGTDRSPVLIGDVAEVKIGHAIRYGAMCYNNDGEVAGAVVMMLKGANSSEVVKNVKQKVEEINASLPEGVVIEPFLDRTKMVNNAIHTVEKNLIEGALIVIFVLVLFLGNFRAGFIVASVIPLSMLFAVIMMNLFGVSGNLMSLGAIDFGLIVDGAVIIVEAVMHKLHHSALTGGNRKITATELEEEVKYSAGKMMNSAAFGQVIILMVYLPILSLEGIEGKMFRPMAQTVAFALVGALILSVTYVPMAASLFLSKNLSTKAGLFDRVMDNLRRGYKPVLLAALRKPVWVISAAFITFALSVFILSRMGGEFIPELEEGDLALDTRVLPGSNLNTTIEATQKAAGILLERFPEIEKVVTKIGSAEIPTDPMPPEASDMMVILKDKKEWTSAESFDELSEKMNEALSEVPGISVGFQFPVQMRFNELMTGARQDVVCKIFGENLDTLAAYADRIGHIINSVEGAKDLYVEKVTGMPQLVVNIKREALARYGLSVNEVNRTLKTAFAGESAGYVYEGEKRFDLMVRMEENLRKNPDYLKSLPVTSAAGINVPMSELADVKIQEGPYQIQRENAKRRITAGFNVRGRDVQTVVKELETKVKSSLKLPSGYTIHYGGQFENLNEAKSRLAVAVPIVLLLILALLYFAFNSLKHGLLIFTAIPLSAIGGILALSIRGMPFSISAGVGFIALFGVAVLNGIVLIAEFNRNKKSGMTDLQEVVVSGALIRLRPVLMTASVASLGFLPMAISQGAGAEVQRPLATVVIGGLITSTLLTLVVLPVLYVWAERLRLKNPGVRTIPILIGLLPAASAYGQNIPALSLTQALDSAQKNNFLNQAAEAYIKSSAALIKSGTDIPNTEISLQYGQYNSAFLDYQLGISQRINFPVVYTAQTKLLRSEYESSKWAGEIQKNDVRREVRLLFYRWQILDRKEKLLIFADSLFKQAAAKISARTERGQSSVLEKLTAENQSAQIAQQLEALRAEKENTVLWFSALLNSPSAVRPETADPKAELPEISNPENFPSQKWKEQLLAQARNRVALQRAKLFPDLIFGYYNTGITGFQNIYGFDQYYGPHDRLSYITAGISVPLFFRAQSARIKSSALQARQAEWEFMAEKQKTQTLFETEKRKLYSFLKILQDYENSLLPNADNIARLADEKLKRGDADFLEWVILINQAISVKSGYLDYLEQYNRAAIELLYLNAK